eukprot:gene3675-4021_t
MKLVDMRYVVVTLLLLASAVSFRPITTRSRRLPSLSTLFSSPDNNDEDLTKTIFDKLQKVEGVGGSGGSSSYAALKGMDSAWKALKGGGWAKASPQIVFDVSAAEAPAQVTPFDVIVCGGTLGIFYAAALQRRGFRVAVVERLRVAGRAQEWNISEKELLALTREGLLSEEDLRSLISVKFNPARVGFRLESSPAAGGGGGGGGGGGSGWEAEVSDVLNLGVRPDRLVDSAKKAFEEAGGAIFENASLEKVEVYADVAHVVLTGGTQAVRLSCRLLLDAMGHSSPIARQFRGPVPPDGVCIVVGSCARGYPAASNTCSDIIFSDNPPISTGPSHDLVQYFWEAFPSGSGPQDRTTYLFAYMDAEASRPGVEDMLRDYWQLLPRYQGVPLDQLTFLRVLYGVFPTYRSSPLRPPIGRILQVGDASGIQSPLSFGGFGSLTRHLPRILAALEDALRHDLLTAEDLGEINSYQPNLSACWMFQKSMSVPAKVKGQVPADLVISTLRSSFRAMEQLGDSTMRPFLQDVVQFKPLVLTLLTALRSDWSIPVRVLPLIGFGPLIDFVRHLIALGVYDALHRHVSEHLSKWVESSSLPMRQKYWWRRRMEAWKYGSGLDYNDH